MRTSRYRELLKEMEALQKKIDAARTIERDTAINQCLALIGEYDLTRFELGFAKVQHVKAAKVKRGDKTFTVQAPKSINPPKYQDPQSGATWSGRGKAPGWLVGPREDYLLDTPQTRGNGRMPSSMQH